MIDTSIRDKKLCNTNVQARVKVCDITLLSYFCEQPLLAATMVSISVPNSVTTHTLLKTVQNYELRIQYLSMFHTLQNSGRCTVQFPEKRQYFRS